MREVTTRVYQFDELTDAAKEKAVTALREKLGGDWWDQGDNDDVQATMVYTLAEKLGTPGWNTFGVADFPGIDGVRVDGWSLDQHQALALSGTLTRDTAPALPWADGVGHVELTGHRSNATTVFAVDVDPDDDHLARVEDDSALVRMSFDRAARHVHQGYLLAQVVREAIGAAWTAGEKEAEYKCGEERAREVAADHEFTEDGTLYS